MCSPPPCPLPEKEDRPVRLSDVNPLPDLL